jgi:hypothetical protein
VSEANLVATLLAYPNLILVMAGHRHQNVVTPFPSPVPDHPEYGFWQDEHSLAWRSRAYGIAAERIYGRLSGDDTASRTYNAELVVPLTPTMQAMIASYGTSLAYRTYIDHNEEGIEVGFLGRLESADTLSGSWSGIPSATNSPWRLSAPHNQQFFRAVK